MTVRWDEAARRVRAFVEHPVTNLVKGVILVSIGLSEVCRTFREDLLNGHVRVGHGLIIIGLFSILDALPHFLDALDASGRYLEYREEKDRAIEESGAPRADRIEGRGGDREP